jgi:hypothetical protein
MGMTPLVITATIAADDDAFVTEYEERRFLGGYAVFCKYCSPQRRAPSVNEIDVADGTLRIEKRPDDEFHLAQYSDSFDVAVETDTETLTYRYSHEFRARNPSGNSEYEAVIHIVLPAHCLPDPASIAPPPQYGWRFRDRFALGWLSGFMQLDHIDPNPIIGRHSFTFAAVDLGQFNHKARQLSYAVRELAAASAAQQSGALAVVVEQNQLSATGYRRIHAALTDGYNRASLAYMLGAALGERLDLVASAAGNFREIVNDVIRWAEREERIDDLVEGAATVNTTNDLIRVLHRDYAENPRVFYNQ